jgi:two-component system phosphate regulon response regulator PhoB
MKVARVLVVEDESAIAELISINLRHNGMLPMLAADGVAAQKHIDEVLPDVILLDWMLPGQSGLELARRWRTDPRTKSIPILMLTARGDEPDKIAGLDAGADDYITKPFSPRELNARIKALIRRKTPEHSELEMRAGPLTVDPVSCRVSVDGQAIEMGHAEFKLLRFLIAHPERVFTRGQLLDKVWGDHVVLEERTVDVHILRLRKALAPADGLIKTVRSVGYMLSEK